MRRLLLLLTAVLVTASPALAQTDVLWDVVVPSGAKYIRTSADGTVTVGGSTGQNEASVTRLSAAGATLWSADLSPGNVSAMALGPDGSAYVLLQVQTSGPTNGDVGVVRVDPDGTVAWRRTYDGANSGSVNREYDSAVDLAVDGQGNVFATATDGSADNAQLTWSLMHSADGTLLWSRTYTYLVDGSAVPTPKRAGMDCAGNAYVMGEMRSGRNTGDPGFLISYAPDGTLRQQAVLNAPAGGSIVESDTYFHDLAVACDGTAYVAGVEQVFRNPPDIHTQTAFVLRYDVGGTTPAWAAAPFGNQSGAGLGITGGHVNLAIGGPDAVYVQAATVASPTSTGTVRTVRLRADGAAAWLDEGPAGARLDSRRIAADAGGVVVAAAVRPEPTVSATLYRHLSSEGVETWAVQRIHGSVLQNVPLREANTMATHPGGGAVWTETFGHVVRVGEPPPPPPPAEVQIVHASAAILFLGRLEVYLNQPATSTTPDAVVGFFGGSTFLDVPAGEPINVRVRPVTAPQPPAPREYTLTSEPLASGRYAVNLAGIPDEILSQYDPNPSGILQRLRLQFAMLEALFPRENPLSGGVPIVVSHAVTDAPALDVVVAETGQVLADDLLYGQAGPPATLPAGAHRVEVRNAATGALIEAVRFTLDGTETALPLLIAGFLNPAANQNGPALSLTATDETGAVDPGVVVTGTDEAPGGGLTLTVANPARGPVAVRYALPAAGPARLVVVDVLGREVAVLADGERAAGDHEARLDAGALAPGLYVLRLDGAAGRVARTVTVVR